MSIDQNNPTTIPSGMLSAINGGAKVVFVSATPTAVFQGALATAKQHGTVVIDVASGNTPTSGVAALVNNAAANGPEWGSMLALGALADAQDSHDKNASILLVTAPLFETILGPTDTAVAATVKKYCGGCGLDTLGIPANDLFGGKAPADIVSYMQAHPDVKYILQDSSLTDPGLTAALSGAGFGKVKVLGVAPLALQVASVRSGTELGWVVDPLNVEGWMAVDAAARKITGAKATAYNTKGIPSYLLVKSNSHDATEVPSGYQQMFKRLWHVSH
jgi:ABC-type sugar transport system substrate-binding protein